MIYIYISQMHSIIPQGLYIKIHIYIRCKFKHCYSHTYYNHDTHIYPKCTVLYHIVLCMHSFQNFQKLKISPWVHIIQGL